MALPSAALLVLEALTGRSYELECTGATRVDAVTHALADLSGVSPDDQILTLGPARLEPARTLSVYGLPAAGDAARVFLYSRASLRPGAAPPPPEAPPALPSLPPAPPEPLHAPSDSPLPQRDLAYYAAQFAWHAATGRALLAALQAKLALCARLVAEVHVQALAVDSARENVDVHFAYICRAQASFERRFAASHGGVASAVTSFEAALLRCASAELHPQVQARWARAAAAAAAAAEGGGGCADVAASLCTPTSLADLFPRDRLRRAAAEGARGRDALAAKAAELSAALAALQRGTEALFMAGPAVDVAALQQRLQGAGAHADRAAASAAALDGDAETARRLAADGLPFCSDGGGGGEDDVSASVAPLGAADACAALEAMHARHRGSELATLRAAEASLSALLTHAVACKASMTRAAAEQLAQVAALQSGIRALRNRQAALGGAAAALGEACTELARVVAAPAAYAAALAEAARRRAASAALAAAAGAAAERLAAARGAEATARDAFRTSAAAAALPPGLARAMGLEAPPPSVEVSLRATDAALVPVSDEEVRRLSAELLASAAAGAWRATAASASSASSSSGDASAVSSSPPHVAVPPQLPRSPKRGVGASIAHALQRRASGGSSLLGALVGAASGSAAVSTPQPQQQRAPSPALLRRSGSGIEAPPPPAISSLELFPAPPPPPPAAALDAQGATAEPQSQSQSQSPGTAAENAALRAELAAAVATLGAAAAGAPPPGVPPAAAALAAALAARDEVANTLRADLDAARAEAEALRRRCAQLEAALEHKAGEAAVAEETTTTTTEG